MTSQTLPDRPLVSVLLLCYNLERYVNESLDGLSAQTYSPLDIVIVDDYSSDRTAEIIETRVAKRGSASEVRFVRNSRNMVHPIPSVIGTLKGEFIIIASGDDVMLPKMVEQMVRTWIEENVSLVTGNVIYVDEHSNPLERTYRHPELPVDESFETLARDGSNDCCFGAAMGFDREIFDTFGWPPTDFLGASDIVLPFYAYLLRGARFIKEPLLRYRVHSHNTSLSLLAEKSTGEDRLLANERIFSCHLAHAIFFDEELDKLRSSQAVRYAQVADRIRPLLAIQMIEMARKLVRNRRALHNFRIKLHLEEALIPIPSKDPGLAREAVVKANTPAPLPRRCSRAKKG